MPRRFTYPLSHYGYGEATSNAGSSPAIMYFQDGYESGTFLTTDTPPGAWSQLELGAGGYAPAIQSVIKHSGTYAYDQEYFAYDPVNPIDLNRACMKNFGDFGFPTGLSHYFFRFYIYQKTPESDTTPSAIYQGKIIRIWSDRDNFSLGTGDNEVELVPWNGSGGTYSATTRYIGLGVTGVADTIYNIGTYGYDTWVCIEQEVLMNTPGVADGTYRLWVNGTLSYENLALNIRSTSTKNSLWMRLGAQVSVSAGITAHEHRYFDDIKISNSYIGP